MAGWAFLLNLNVNGIDMATLINNVELERIVSKVLEDDMNKCLDETVAKVISELHDRVRVKVAARMIALCSSDYNMEYLRNELRISVKINSK